MTPQSPAQTLDDLAGEFATHRRKLYAIAHRTLGSPWSADDAMQEVWLRLQRADSTTIDNLEAWSTTVVSRMCIDMIRQQVSRREDLDQGSSAEAEATITAADPAEKAMRSDDLALAMQVVLDSLGPLERLALMLHDIFALSYDDIAPRSNCAATTRPSRSPPRGRSTVLHFSPTAFVVRMLWHECSPDAPSSFAPCASTASRQPPTSPMTPPTPSTSSRSAPRASHVWTYSPTPGISLRTAPSLGEIGVRTVGGRIAAAVTPSRIALPHEIYAGPFKLLANTSHGVGCAVVSPYSQAV